MMNREDWVMTADYCLIRSDQIVKFFMKETPGLNDNDNEKTYQCFLTCLDGETHPVGSRVSCVFSDSGELDWLLVSELEDILEGRID